MTQFNFFEQFNFYDALQAQRLYGTPLVCGIQISTKKLSLIQSVVVTFAIFSWLSPLAANAIIKVSATFSTEPRLCFIAFLNNLRIFKNAKM